MIWLLYLLALPLTACGVAVGLEYAARVNPEFDRWTQSILPGREDVP